MIDQIEYALVGWIEKGESRSFLTIEAGGEDALAVFESVEDAEAHAALRDLKPGWSVVPGSAEELRELLARYTPAGIEHVVLNPHVATEDGPPVEVGFIPIRRFIEQ